MKAGDCMQLKRVSLIVLICGLVLLAVGLGLPLVSISTASTGIIGGADAATYQYLFFNLFRGLPMVIVLFGFAMLISSGFCLLFSKTVLKHCSSYTSAVSLALPCVGGAGLNCALIWLVATPTKNPIALPVSVAGSLACFAIFVVLYVLYSKKRKENLTAAGIAIDFLTGIVYLPAFFWFFSWLGGVLQAVIR